ncbi:MAG: ABC transporter permease subunit [Bacilli bacterium]
MEKKDNFINKVFKSVKNLFVSLFGFGKHKNEMNDELIENINSKDEKSNLKEEEILSPTKQIFKKFIKNRIAIVGLVMFISVLGFVVIGSNVMDFDKAYQEPSQRYLPPKLGYNKVPRGLIKEGVKLSVDSDGLDVPLMGVGASFTVAISNANKIYMWGANVENVMDIPDEVKEKAGDITQLSVGTSHVLALTSDNEFYAWGNKAFEITAIPKYNPAVDSTFYQFKKSIDAYFRPESRELYPEDVITKIEEDPIKKIYAGDNFTTIFTESGVVYTWGITNSLGISAPAKSFKALEINTQYANGHIRWKFNAEGVNRYRDFISLEELSTRFGFPAEQEVDEETVTTRVRLRTETVKEIDPITLKEVSYREEQVQYYDEDAEDWVRVVALAELLDEIKDKTDRHIVDIHVLYEHLLYELDDNSFIQVGFLGPVQTGFPEELKQSEAQRGYRITKVIGSFRNGIYLTDEGDVKVWGEKTALNNLNDVPEAVLNSKIDNISTGATHMLAVDNTGKVHIWGYRDRLNQLSMPDNLPKSRFTVSGFFNSYSIGEDGSIIGWGNNGYILGTDANGANNLHRIIAGGTKTMSLALVAVVVSLVIGLTVGLTAGFYGKWLDNILMRFGEIINAFPFLPLAMTLAKIVEEYDFSDTARVYLIMVILGLLSWPGLARLVRGQILAEREKDYIMAAKSLGIKERHIILRHILPNVVNVVIVSTTLSYAGALLTESGLSFLGFGVKAPEPTWGNMLTGAQDISVLQNYWWVWIIPAFFIIITALSVNLVGDGLRDAMDPKSNER